MSLNLPSLGVESTRSKVLRSAIWTTNSKLLAQGTGFLTTLVLARLLSRGDFGLMAMALSFMGLMDTFIDLGFLSAIIQAKEISRRQLSSCFWMLTLISLFFASCGFFSASYISEFFAEPNLSILIMWLTPILLFSPMNIVCKGVLSRDIRLDVLAKIELYSSIAKMIITICLAYMGMGVVALVIGYIVERVFQTIACAMKVQWRPSFEYDKSCVRSFLNFGSKVSASSLLWYIFTKADVFVIGRVLGAEVLGVYTIASQFPQTIARLVPNVWIRIAYPLFAKFQQAPELKLIVMKSSFLLNLICLPLFLGMAAIAPDIINVVFGERWHEAIFPLQMLSVTAVIETATGILPSVLNAIGRPGVNTVINMVAVLVFPLALYLGAQQWGISGVLWVTVILYAYRYIAFLLTTCRLLNLSVWEYGKGHSANLMIALVMFFTLKAFFPFVMDLNVNIKILICIVAGSLLYSVLQILFNKKSIQESVMIFKTL